MIRKVAIAFFSTVALAACNPYDPELPNKPFECGGPDNDQCPEGYTCNDAMVCENVDTGGDVDASTAFSCSDDTALEPNEIPDQAYRTPIPNARPDYVLRNLSICAPGDRDHFRFGVDEAATKVEISVVGLAGRPSLNIDLLNAGGMRIANGAPVTAAPQQVRLAEQNLALGIGDYIVRIDSPDPTGQNNYEITIKTCPSPLPCP